MFRKVLVANRGEIARRIIRALKELNIPAVAVYSEADAAALHVQEADEAVPIGPAPATASYLNGAAILAAARQTGADAIHPGYGFLSENAAFARQTAEAGLTFIGPAPEVIAAMGSKVAAREIARQVGVPLIPGSTGAVKGAAEALAVADATGYPVMVKASAGGGGMGMRIARHQEELERFVSEASRDAERFFGDPEIFIERYLEAPRHIEVQVLGDRHGQIVHLGERECSIQRRNQKLIEESPAPNLPETVREAIHAAALRLARAIGYQSAGTLEFLYDGRGQYYFLEMNTRLQVEHPVTEWVTGIDLVREQIRLAAGEPLGYAQDQIRLRGHAIECRINAEDPAKGFMPSLGTIAALREPAGPGVRVDSSLYPGLRVPVHYDSLLAKLVVWDVDRPRAVRRLRRALTEYQVEGIRTTLDLYRRVVIDAAFVAGDVDTGFIARMQSGA